MSTGPEDSSTIYHLALLDEWEQAAKGGTGYRRSTFGASLEEVGFIHCSFAHQVQRIADLVYRDRADVVLVVIETALVEAEVRVENLEGGDDEFPHIYGPIRVDAVVRVLAVPLEADGRLAVRALLDRAP